MFQSPFALSLHLEKAREAGEQLYQYTGITEHCSIDMRAMTRTTETSKRVTKCFKRAFATHGIPDLVVSGKWTTGQLN